MTEFGGAAVAARIAEIRSRFSSGSARPANAPTGANFAGSLARLSTVGSNASGSGTGQQVVDIAKQWLGTPYVYGGNDPEKGIDCSGLVQQAYKRVGIDLPRVTYDQVNQGEAVNGIENAKPGDLIFCTGDGGRKNGHVGIFMGDGKWIEAPYTGAQVRIADIPKNISAIRRVVPEQAATPAPSAALSQLAAGLQVKSLQSLQGMTA
jgi:cell wall-associated NlpC family hydrolase